MPARKGRHVNCAEIGAVHASATIIIEVFNAPFSGAVAVFDDGDILLKRVAHQHVLESLSGSNPLPLGGLLGGYDFLETSRLVRHCCPLSPSSRTGCWLGGSESSPTTPSYSKWMSCWSSSLALCRQGRPRTADAE